jgi:uncharacterized protein (TIGR02271 family)
MDSPEQRQERAVPVIEEELVTGTRTVKTGSVRIHKEVEEIRKTVEMPTFQDVVEVTRKAVNRVVTASPEIREEGDLVIIPVVEEEIVVRKRLVLKEEIHIRRRRTEDVVREEVTLARERATVERLDETGRVVETSEPAREAGERRFRRRGD